MISAHLNGQIFASIGICPYCSMGKEHSLNVRKYPHFLIVNPFKPKSCIKNGQITPNTVTRPYRPKCLEVVDLCCFCFTHSKYP